MEIVQLFPVFPSPIIEISTPLTRVSPVLMNLIYLNNTLIGSTQTTGSQPESSNGGIHLMRRWDNPEFWDGYLAKVDIYNQDISASQITNIWNLNKSRFGL